MLVDKSLATVLVDAILVRILVDVGFANAIGR